MYNPFSLTGKTILVTGASSGIGRVVAIECAKMGASLVITGRDAGRLDETFALLEGDKHIRVVADLSKYEDIENLVNQCPPLDGFSNNAGIIKVVLVKFISREYLGDTLSTNTIAPILLTQLLVKKKKLNRSGSIVYTSSLTGVYCVHYGESMYAASKGAISGFAKGAALDLATQNIRVNCVNPGIVRTEIFENSGVIPPEQLEEKIQLFPLKRLGRPTDVAFAIIYFLSDASAWVTGNNLKVDGGYTLI